MRLVWLIAMALPVFGQIPSRAPAKPLQEVPAKEKNSKPNFVPVIVAVAVPSPAAAEKPLVASSLYQPEQAAPVLREYGFLPPALARPLPVVAFLDGHVEAVCGYWVEDAELVYVTVRKDRVRRVKLDAVDVRRSEQLNRQRGIVFRVE